MPQDKAKASKTNGKKLTKADAVRQALGRLGADAKPLDIKPFLQQEFGINMSTSMISSYKSSENKRAATQSRVARRAARAAQNQFSLEDVQAVKQLTERIGAEKVRELADLFG